MAITTDDVKILKSERMTDAADGGGRAVGEAVVDNKMNEVFPNISRLDRTLGNVDLRKLYAGVVTENNDVYLGAHAIVTEKAKDPLVDTLLFSTNSQTDERADAQHFVEGYVVPSIEADFELLGDQYAGQRSLTCIAFESRPIPEIGDVYQLVADAYSQFVRITSVEHELREFYEVDMNGNLITFTRRYMKIDISSALLKLFPGGQPTLAGTTARNLDGIAKSRVRATEVADSARYFGLNALAEAVSQGAMELKVSSIYAQLVPSTIRESALVDQVAGSHKRFYVETSTADRTVSVQFTSPIAGESRTFIGTSAYRGSVRLTVGGAVWQDNGAGEFRLQSGASAFDKITIDYEVGAIIAYRSSAYTGSASITYRPGAALTGQSVTGELPIRLGNRGYVYTLNLSEAKPRPGTLTISFMALGRWYGLRDNGDGKLTGEGSGTVDFASGSVNLTLDALPDVDTSIIYDYIAQDDFNYKTHLGFIDAGAVTIEHELPDKGISPSGVSVKLMYDGVQETLTSDSSGQLSGWMGTGVVYAADGIIKLTLNKTPDAGSSVEISYSTSDDDSKILTSLTLGADGAGMTTGIIPGAPLEPGTVSLTWDVRRKSRVPKLTDGNLSVFDTESTFSRSVSDDASGSWRGRDGFINYATGEFAIRTELAYSSPEYSVSYNRNSFGRTDPKVESVNAEARESFAGTVLVRAQKVSALYVPVEISFSPALDIQLLSGTDDGLVPGSLIASWNGAIYTDRDGVVYRDIDSRTNAGIAVGRIDYASGKISFSSWPANVDTTTFNRLACATVSVGFSTTAVFFRTPGAPIRPASLQITAVRVDTAEIITATPNLNGEISTPQMYGHVDSKTGITRLQFTSDPDDESGLSDIPVIAVLLRYNAVLQSSMPMDAKLLGLDPVRLPADGRVPVYREGDVLVIHHTAETAHDPQPGETLVLPRAEQAEIYVVDAEGTRLDESQYTTDREAGSITFNNPLVLQDVDAELLVPPYRVCDRVEHMTVCTEVQITGALSINSPLPFDAPANETKVSSALTWGDMQARLYRWFTQKTWNTGSPNWTDNPIGDQTTAQYNQLNYPPIVTNIGAIAGRWALVFTSSTAFQIVEQQLGIIGNGSTSSDTSPINPATGTPYFVIKKEGWGIGWAAGNAIRFNTDACLGPMWCVRTVQPGKGTVDDDHFRLQVRGDAD